MACCHDFIESLPSGYDTVIGEGRIESGTHEKLMTTNKIYSRFVRMRQQALDWKME